MRIYVGKSDEINVNENNLVNLKTESGDVYEALEPRRLFPVSRADSYITLLDKDGCEVAIIRELSDISPEAREVISYSLDDYYLVPHITKILSAVDKHGKTHWCVETDRGYKEFDIRVRSQDIRVSRDGRIRVRDSDDNRYIITDYRALDKHSKSQLIGDI